MLFRSVFGAELAHLFARGFGLAAVLEAILWHGGEAEAAREQVRQLSAEDREALVKFVESL